MFHTALEHTLITLNEKNLKYYIYGDVNINLLDYDIKSNIKEYSDMLFNLGCIPLYKYPTRITQTSSTLSDHIYTVQMKYVKKILLISYRMIFQITCLYQFYCITSSTKKQYQQTLLEI